MTNSNPALVQAASFDEVHDHDEAINVLARATQGGDLGAMTALGKRLLVGDRAPYLPREGADMVFEAANKGFAEAIAQVAVFKCTGIGQEKDWGRSLQALTLAASRGWKPAREQLLLLKGETLQATEDFLETEDDSFWQSTAQAVDLNLWLAPVQGEALNSDPLVMLFRNFIPLEICKLLIRQSADRLLPALVYDPVNRRNIRYKTRTNSIAQFNLVENEVIHFLLQERMSAACGIPMEQMEATAILNYQPGEEISNHFDFVDPEMANYAQEIADNGQRVITFLIYLNDDYDGGETAFPEMNLSYKGKAGEGLYFVNSLPDGSADVRTLHAGRPPLTGEKWIVSQFVRNRPVKYIL